MLYKIITKCNHLIRKEQIQVKKANFRLARRVLEYISILIIISWSYFKLNDEFNEGGFLYAKLSEEADTRNITVNSIDLSFNNWIYSILTIISISGVLFLFSYLLKALIKSKTDALNAIMLIFIIIHNAKRGFLYLMIDPLTFFYFALLFSSLVSQERKNNLKFAETGEK